ncbi:hypothetical protein BDN67DRAFT_982960 [Paxillus ammoniavirescens]|nr:hypothetical protein BDN67DRAFT_982960 [Paxillus ammoniavirescens]
MAHTTMKICSTLIAPKQLGHEPAAQTGNGWVTTVHPTGIIYYHNSSKVHIFSVIIGPVSLSTGYQKMYTGMDILRCTPQCLCDFEIWIDLSHTLIGEPEWSFIAELVSAPFYKGELIKQNKNSKCSTGNTWNTFHANLFSAVVKSLSSDESSTGCTPKRSFNAPGHDSHNHFQGCKHVEEYNHNDDEYCDNLCPGGHLCLLPHKVVSKLLAMRLRELHVDGIVNALDLNEFVDDVSTQLNGQLYLAGVIMVIDCTVFAIPGFGGLSITKALVASSFIFGAGCVLGGLLGQYFGAKLKSLQVAEFVLAKRHLMRNECNASVKADWKKCHPQCSESDIGATYASAGFVPYSFKLEQKSICVELLVFAPLLVSEKVNKTTLPLALTMWASQNPQHAQAELTEAYGLPSATHFHLQADSESLWVVRLTSPTSIFSSTPTSASSTPQPPLSESGSTPSLYHNQSSSTMSLTSPQSGHSHLEVSHSEATNSSGSGFPALKPVSGIETDLDEVFDRMLNIIFVEVQQPQSKYKGLMQHWMDVIMVQKAAMDTLTFAQQEITNAENELSPIIGPELIQYYHRAYYNRAEYTNTVTAFVIGMFRFSYIYGHYFLLPNYLPGFYVSSLTDSGQKIIFKGNQDGSTGQQFRHISSSLTLFTSDGKCGYTVEMPNCTNDI